MNTNRAQLSCLSFSIRRTKVTLIKQTLADETLGVFLFSDPVEGDFLEAGCFGGGQRTKILALHTTSRQRCHPCCFSVFEARDRRPL